MRAFAAELKSRRTAAGLSQEALALDCGVNRTFVAKLELAVNQPSLTTLLRIADGLGADLPDLISETLRRYRKESKSSRKGTAPGSN